MRVIDSLPKIPASEWERLIDEWVIGENGERDRALMRRRLLDGIHFEPLGEEFLLSTQHTKTIFHKRLMDMIDHIGKN